MLKREFAIGNYVSYESPMNVTSEQRRFMIALIEDLHRAKGYKEETFFLAVSIADRYLVNLTV